MQFCENCGSEKRKYRNKSLPVCAPLQLSLSRNSQLRKRLRAQIGYAGLPIVVFAGWVLGRDPRTLQRWLAGEKIPQSAAIWIERLERVELRGGTLFLELRWQEVRPRWRFFQAQKKRTLYQSAQKKEVDSGISR